MASTLCRRARQLSVGKAVARSVVAAVRVFSTAGSSGSDEPYVAFSPQDSGPRTVWPDEIMGPFGPQDKRFQLPGNVGFECHLRGMGTWWTTLAHRVLPDVLSTPSSSDRHEFVLTQFISEYQSKEASVWTQGVCKAEMYFAHCNVECTMHSCPELLKQELESFFPALPASGITVITVTQKTTAQHTEELDREQLLDKFVSGAKEMCFLLWRDGYWADFIEPSSGKAFFGAPIQDSVLQAEPAHPSGFHIEDLASCRVVRHVLKDMPVFVGTLLTNAPSSSRVMERFTGRSADPQEAD